MILFIYSFFYIVSIISDRILYFEYINLMSKYSWMVSFIVYPVLNFISLSFFVIYSVYKKKPNNGIHQKHFFIDLFTINIHGFGFSVWNLTLNICKIEWYFSFNPEDTGPQDAMCGLEGVFLPPPPPKNI